MLGRVAAWGFAAIILVWPARSGVELSTFANANAPAAAVVIAAPLEQVQDQVQDQTQALARTDSHAPTEVARLEPLMPQIATPALPEPFGLSALPIESGDVLTKWAGVEADIRSEREILARCRASAERCPQVAQDFLAIIAAGRAQDGRARIGVINRAINLAIRPTSDFAQWGVPDHWSAPLDTFTTGRGDCEDYAIAKYVALTEAGVAAADIRLVIVHNTAAGEDHAVAAVRLDGDWILLDNRWLALIEDVDMPHAIPLFVLAEDGVRQFVPAAMAGARRTSAPATF
jgi:predicted transglutaminase-like cysteine proteinase